MPAADDEPLEASRPAAPTFCLYAALLGATNAGKSTLLNSLTGRPLSLVTHKAQTTRGCLQGSFTQRARQVVVVDTPGLVPTPGRRLERAMCAAAWRRGRQSDVVVLVVDAARRDAGAQTAALWPRLENKEVPVFLVLNKIDLRQRARLLPLAADLSVGTDFAQTFMISARNGDGVADLAAALLAAAPLRPWYDSTPKSAADSSPFTLAEVTRGIAFTLLHDEIPYDLMVTTEYIRRRRGLCSIAQVLTVARSSQRAIVVGSKGQSLARIHRRAQAALAERVEMPVRLTLRVRAEPGWMERGATLRALGLPDTP